MGVYFNHIFRGVGMRGLHEGEQDFIDYLLGGGINKMPKIQFVALEFLDRTSWFEYFFRDLVGNGAAYSDDSNPCLADGCGYCSDGVFIQMIIGHHSCLKTVLKFRGLGVSFQAKTISLEVVERPFDRLTVLSHIEGHLIFAYMAAAPQNKVF